MREVVKPTIKYKKAVAAMNDVNLEKVVADTNINYGHSPYAFERIALWLKFNEHMLINDIVEYLANGEGNKHQINIHKNSWIRWATPNHKYQSNNMYYDTWLMVRNALNSLLAKQNRSISDFTHVSTYSPENIAGLRKALGLNQADFAEILGLASPQVVEKIESKSIVVNKTGMGYEDWEIMLDRLEKALALKRERGNKILEDDETEVEEQETNTLEES